MSFIPRALRTERRNEAFSRAYRAAGHTAMETALAAIPVVFGPAYLINELKLRAEKLIAMSYGHAGVRARFRFFTSIIVDRGLDLDQSIALVRTKCRDFGFADELHLILRWMRARGMHQAFAEMVAAERSVFAEAAE
jgi:hypothetical protein